MYYCTVVTLNFPLLNLTGDWINLGKTMTGSPSKAHGSELISMIPNWLSCKN